MGPFPSLQRLLALTEQQVKEKKVGEGQAYSGPAFRRLHFVISQARAFPSVFLVVFHSPCQVFLGFSRYLGFFKVPFGRINIGDFP